MSRRISTASGNYLTFFMSGFACMFGLLSNHRNIWSEKETNREKYKKCKSIFCIKTVAVFIPLMVLFFSAGILFPLHWALVVVAIGLLCEMTIGYFAGKRLGLDKVLERMSKYEKVEKFLNNQKNIGPTICFTASFFPMPFEVLTMFLGAAEIKYPKFLILMYIGLLPLIIPGVFLGEYITTPFSKEFLIPFSLSFLFVLFIFLIYTISKKRKL
jgi:uncharacterized membrane protein YdjX (TVP38/TMEM64 family)